MHRSWALRRRNCNDITRAAQHHMCHPNNNHNDSNCIELQSIEDFFSFTPYTWNWELNADANVTKWSTTTTTKISVHTKIKTQIFCANMNGIPCYFFFLLSFIHPIRLTALTTPITNDFSDVLKLHDDNYCVCTKCWFSCFSRDMDASSITSINTTELSEILLFSPPNATIHISSHIPNGIVSSLELKIGKSAHFTEIKPFRDGSTAFYLAEKSMMKLKYINFVSTGFFFFFSMKMKIFRRMYYMKLLHLHTHFKLNTNWMIEKCSIIIYFFLPCWRHRNKRQGKTIC